MTDELPVAPRQGVRWGRGFFRLWLVLSVMWVVAIFFIVDTPKDLSRAYRLHLSMNAEAAAPVAGSSKDSLIDAALDEAQAELWTRTTQNLRHSASVGFIPPATVLLIGAMIAWALRGFRK